MNDPVLRADEVTKSYDGLEVVRSASLEVGRGEVKVVIGPSGSGKSTLLRCLALLEPVDRGAVFLEGEQVSGLKEKELAAHRSEIGMVFQRFNLFQNMTALALVLRPKAMLFDEPTSALDVELVREVLDVMEGLARDGMTMVVVSHELRFAHHVASSILMMDEGRVIEEAPPDKFFSAPSHERTKRFLSLVE